MKLTKSQLKQIIKEALSADQIRSYQTRDPGYYNEVSRILKLKNAVGGMNIPGTTDRRPATFDDEGWAAIESHPHRCASYIRDIIFADLDAAEEQARAGEPPGERTVGLAEALYWLGSRQPNLYAQYSRSGTSANFYDRFLHAVDIGVRVAVKKLKDWGPVAQAVPQVGNLSDHWSAMRKGELPPGVVGNQVAIEWHRLRGLSSINYKKPSTKFRLETKAGQMYVDQLLDEICPEKTRSHRGWRAENINKEMKVTKSQLKEIIKEEIKKILIEGESDYISNIYKWCPAETKCAPEKQKTKWWKGK